MTLAAIWIESRDGGSQQLCFASDSRTTPGPIDGVTKVVLFGREDIAGVWAGDYRYAMLLQSHLDAVLTASEAMRRRDIDVARAFRQAVTAVQRHLDTSIKPSTAHYEQNNDAQRPESMTMVLGGYSIVKSKFVLLRIEWLADRERWRVTVADAKPNRVIYIGDERKPAKQLAKRARAYRRPTATDSWHMEPLAAIAFACGNPAMRTIGGSLQLAKAYIHGSTRAYGFVDPMRSSAVWVRGTQVNKRAALELLRSGLLIDTSSWQLNHGSFAPCRTLPEQS